MTACLWFQWLSGWDPDAADEPPANYDVPGALPGDGPQEFWQEQIVCFEGELPEAAAAGRPPPPPGQPPGQVAGGLMTPGVIYELWRGMGGGKLTDLSSSSEFPGSPSQRDLYNLDCGQGWMVPECSRSNADIGGYFESPTDIGDQLATRMRGYFKAPMDGCYTFHLASDDDGELWLGGTDEDGEELVPALVAFVPGWTSSRQWEKFPQQTTRPVTLASGRYYLLDAFAKEDGGGDNLAVGVTLPDGTFLAPIPVTGYMYLDQELLRTARAPVTPASPALGGGGGDRGSMVGLPSSYRPCLASARAKVVRCDGFFLFELPDVPSCDPVTMAYCTAPSTL